MIDLVTSALGSIAANGLACCLLMFGSHQSRARWRLSRQSRSSHLAGLPGRARTFVKRRISCPKAATSVIGRRSCGAVRRRMFASWRRSRARCDTGRIWRLAAQAIPQGRDRAGAGASVRRNGDLCYRARRRPPRRRRCVAQRADEPCTCSSTIGPWAEAQRRTTLAENRIRVRASAHPVRKLLSD